MSNAWGAFYWGDYIADTGHLTLAQHGAYLLLMAHYYRTRRPLPANAPVLHRVCRCTTDADREAVNEVLQEFFTLDGDVYRQNRIDWELAKAIDISEKRRAAARAKHEKSRAASAPANAVQVYTQPQPQPQPQERKPSAANASVADDGSEPVISAHEPAEIIPSDQAAIFETLDGLHSNQYAVRLLEEIRFPLDPAMIRTAACALDCEVKAGMSKPGAYEYLLVNTQLAIDRRETIDMVFFTDGKYRPEWRNSNQRQVSTQARSTGNTQRNDALFNDSNPDPRHAPIRELVHQMHLKQFRVKCQWDGSEGKALDRLLSANPSWNQEQIAQMVRNRFDSESIPSDRPRKWLPHIGSYAAGPQDRFNKLKGSGANGNGHGNEKPGVGQIVEREVAILHARRAQ